MPKSKRYPPDDDDVPPSGGGLLELIQTDPYPTLYAIDVPSTPASKLRLTPYPEPLYFERDSAGEVILYKRGSIGHGEVTQDIEATLPTVELVMENLTKESVALAESYGGFVGQKVRICHVHLPDLPDAIPIREETYTVREFHATESTITLSLGEFSPLRFPFPTRRISRLRCGWKYGGAGCGYDTTRAGAMQTCSKIEEGTNGCIAHGLDEAAASLENRHPRRMLRFAGVQRKGGIGIK